MVIVLFVDVGEFKMNSAIKPKWGGYAPTAAKDVNKHKIEKINRFIKETKKEVENSTTNDVYDVVINQTKLEVLEELAKLIK